MERSWITRYFDEALRQQRLEEKCKHEERTATTGKRESTNILFGQLVDAIVSDIDDWNEMHPRNRFLIRRTRDLCEVSLPGELKAELRLDITLENDIYWLCPERPLTPYQKREEKDGLIWVSAEPDSCLFWNDRPISQKISPEDVSTFLLSHISSCAAN